MANARRSYGPADEIALTTQVGGYCPLCGRKLFYTKRSRSQKAYELAHVYPLNPRLEELEELKGVSLLHSDLNHPDNLIPLCTDCHTRFDKPRTRQEYEVLAEIKRKLIAASLQRALLDSYPLESDIARIIERLYEVTLFDGSIPTLDPQARDVDEKFDSTMPVPTRRKIKHAIADYYLHVKECFREIEFETPVASSLIFSQVHSFYLKQSSLGLPQAEIFSHVVDWISSATAPETTESAEIVASFFVQSCEVFE
jgi:hypothetical protein